LKNNDLPSISAFPKDGKSWRIDWFGELAFPNRSIRRTQPSLLVHLSRVVDTTFREDPSVLLFPDSTSPAKYQRKIWASVGTLPLLRIGDIWRDGKLEASPDYQLESFADLQVDDRTVHLIKAGLNLDDKGFLLPLSEHPWHVNCTHSYCVMVELAGNRRLIIPCIEMIRFYFGSSSSLITKLFLPPLERRALYSNTLYNGITGRLTLDLEAKISGASAADLGRMHLDPIAWRAALHIGTSALKASLSSEHVYPQTFFPFEGETTLVAAGKWLSLGDQPQTTFVVYSLRSCSHPFPFRSLHYRIQDGQRNLKGNDCASKAGVSAQSRGAAHDSPNQAIVEQDASNSLSAKTKNVSLEPRFPDLRQKSIWKNVSIATATTGVRIVGSSGPGIGQSSIGAPGSEQRIRPLELAVALDCERKERWKVPEFLREPVDDLAQLSGFDIELLTESEEDGWTVPITALSNMDGEIDLRLFVDGGDGILRLRKAAVFAIRRNKEHFSVVLIESIPLKIALYTTKGKHTDEICEALTSAANDFLLLPPFEDSKILELIERALADAKPHDPPS
jgi:hypothetical protein